MIKRAVLAIVFTTSAIIAALFSSGSAHATGFDPTRIIDDGIFYNSVSMSVQDIQNFLNSKVPTCDTNGTQTSEFGGGTRAQYGTAHGYPPPYICLKNYYENPTTLQNNLNGTTPAGAISAAQIIFNAAQSYRINPEVILVTLQKESSLITDTWPFPSQYRTAMGYGCPDSGPNNSANCSSNYYGFYNQVTDAAWQFRQYATNPNSFNYVPGPGNYVQYNPNAACGGTTLNIQNQATASLYDYTPYQPNAAALAAGYGTGDSCSAYGNRNFWLYFTSWFGSTTTPPFNATYYSQSAYPTLQAGQSAPSFFMYQNTGVKTWYDDQSIGGAPSGSYPVHLAVTNPINSNSVFSQGWPSAGRPDLTFSAVYESDGTTLAANQHVVQPGQIAKFGFNVTVPQSMSPGTYTAYFQPVLEGALNWNMSGVAWTVVTIIPTINAAQYINQTAYPTLQDGQVSPYFFRYKNTGNTVWYDDTNASAHNAKPVHLAITNPINSKSSFGWDWPSLSRPAATFSAVYESDGVTLAADQHAVQPGQIARFSFNITVPYNFSPDTYRYFVQPVLEGASDWNMGGTGWFDVSVVPDITTAQYAGQAPYPTLSPGQASANYLQYKNTGNTVWYDDTNASAHNAKPVHLAITNPINSKSSFGWDWPSLSRPDLKFSAVYEADGTTLAADQHTVQPGQIVKFGFNITVPYNYPRGKYTVYFQPVLEGASNWNLGGVAWTNVTVN